MAATTGAISGTTVLVAMETAPASGTFTAIGGQTSHSASFATALIDITNKSSASFRELLVGEGLKTLDVGLELVFNSEVTFLAMKDIFTAAAEANFQIARGGEVIEGAFMIPTWSEATPDNDKITVSVSLQSQREWTIV